VNFAPEREVDRAAQPFQSVGTVFERAECEPVEETGQGRNFRGCSSPAERSFDMREAERAALSTPTIF